MMKTLQKGVLILLALFITVSVGAQTTLNVPSAAYPTIQAAIDAASAGDIINVAAGETLAEGIIIIDKDLTIQGESVTNLPEITPTTNTGSNNAIGSGGRGWFQITNANVVIKNLTFNGSGKSIHTAVHYHGDSHGGTVENCVFKNIAQAPSTYNGRGINNYGQTLYVTNCSFENIYRIGIFTYNESAKSIITNCTYVGKSEGDWLDYAAEAGNHAEVNISGCTISECKGIAEVDNSCSAAILATDYYGTGTVLVASNNTIINNRNGINVGYNDDDHSTATISGNTFSNQTENNLCFKPNIIANLDDIFDNNTFDKCAVITDGTNIKAGTNFATKIQNAINESTEGDIIEVSPATYTEQLHITTNNITIQGSATDDVIIKSPENLIEYFTKTENKYPIVFIDNVTNATINNLTVDGDYQGDTNEDFNGIGIWNSGATLENLIVINIIEDIISGDQHGVGVYSNNNTGGPYTINIDNVDIDNFQKNAFAINGDGLTISVSNCDVSGAGPTSVIAQNGIQVWGNSTATIDNCTITGIKYTGSGSSASGILGYYADNISCTNCTVNSTGNSIQCYCNLGDIVNIENCTINNSYESSALYIRPYGTAKSTVFDPDDITDVQPYGDGNTTSKNGKTDETVATVKNCTFNGTGISAGQRAICLSAKDNSKVNLEIQGCTINDWKYAFLGFNGTGTTVNVNAHENNLADNYVGFHNPYYQQQTAKNNYWGAANGPENADSNPNGEGSYIYDNVAYLPFYTDAAMTTLYTPPVVHNATQNADYNTIQEAINSANDNDVLNIAEGLYNEALTINKPLTLNGEGIDKVFIDLNGLTSFSNGAGIHITSDNVSLKNFTLTGTTKSANPRYGIKYNVVDNGIIENVRVMNMYRSGFDILGCSNMQITGAEAMDNGGHGIALCDCHNITLSSITTEDNGWQAVSIGTNGHYSPLGTDGIVLQGTNNIQGVFQIEEGYYNGALLPESMISYSTNISDGADVTVPSSIYTIALTGGDDENPPASGVAHYQRTYFFASMQDAVEAASIEEPIGHILEGARYMISIENSHNLYVDDGCSIQAAIDGAVENDHIYVAPGTYYESIEITKPLSLYGATYTTPKDNYTIPANDLFDETVESIIIDPNPTVDHNATVLIQNTDNVNFKGFVIQQFEANKSDIDALIYVYAKNNAIDNIDVSNNVAGPFTNITSQDGSHGRFGIILSGGNSAGNDMTNIDIHNNLVYKTEGNGSCIMAIGGYHYNTSITPSNMTGSTIRNNTIFGSHRCGLEIVAGIDNLVIEENEIFDNSGFASDDPDKLKHGSGILVIRGSSDKVLNSEEAYAPENTIIRNNEIYNNEKNGIYWGPKNHNNLIEGNNIHDNGWDGIMIDLCGQYWNPTFEPEPSALDYALFDGSMNVIANQNILSGNTLFGARVTGEPTNGFQLQAQLNYWGDASGPHHPTLNNAGTGDEVSDYVLFEPWYEEETMTGNLLLASVDVPTDAYPNLNAALAAVEDEGTINIIGDFAQPQVVFNKSVTITSNAATTPVITPQINSAGALITFDYNTEIALEDIYFDFSGANTCGAVIACQGTEATIEGCTFTGHATSANQEKALVITNGSEVAVQACTFSGFGSGTETGVDLTEAAIHIHNGGGNAPEVEITPDNYFDNNYIAIHVGVDAATEDNSEVLINENIFGETTCNAYAIKIENHSSEVTAHENVFHCHTIYMVSAPTGGNDYDFSFNYWEEGCPAKGGTYEGDINDVPQYTDENLNSLDVSVFIAPATSLTTGGATGLTYNVNISNVTCMGGFDVTLTIADAYFENISFAQGTFLSSQGTTTWQPSNSGESYTLSCSLDGTTNNATGAGTLFTITLDTKGAENLTGALIDITAVTLRGPNNEPITCSGFADGIVYIDNTAPQMTTIEEAENAYYNTAPTLATFEFSDNHGLNRIEFKYDEETTWQEIINDISGTTWDGTEGNTPDVYTLPNFTSLTEGTHTIKWRVTDDAGNINIFGWNFFKDTQIPAGNLTMAISNVTTTGMTITGEALEDAVEGHEYYIFDCINAFGYDKLRAENINQYDLTGMETNTRYQFKYKATDGVTNNNPASNWEEDANITDWSYTYARYTLSVEPDASTVTCDKTPETWYNEPTFTFTSVDGFGEGTNVEYYRYVWDRHATHSWNGVEDIWNADDLALSATDGDNWYLHVKGYNGDNIANGTFDLGPFYYDGTAPYPVAAFNAYTSNNANNSATLTWLDDSQDENFEHYEIFAASYGDYPTYVGSEKASPADYAAAVASSDWTSIGTTTDLTFTHTSSVRDYYYYVVFAKDLAGNYSIVSAKAECLSYWLGDVASTDGIVDVSDIGLLASAWGGDVATYPEINVGPTVDNARDSRPTPDNAIDFEDLMIFSMNYNNTNYGAKAIAAFESDIYLSMHRSVVDGKMKLNIYLTGNNGNVHGLDVKINLGSDIEISKVNKGDVWTDMDFFMYTCKDGVLEITGATLGNGTTIAGDGEIAEIIFDMNGDNTNTEYLLVTARDVENHDIDIILNPVTGLEEQTVGENAFSSYPNPFSNSSTITFTTNSTDNVQLIVYDQNGRAVRVLVDELTTSGAHEVQWDGCDSHGNTLSNGIYFLHLHTDAQSDILKTILTR